MLHSCELSKICRCSLGALDSGQLWAVASLLPHSALRHCVIVHSHNTPTPQVVTPWEVAGGADGGIDYDKLVRDVSRGRLMVVPRTAACKGPPPLGCSTRPAQQAACAGAAWPAATLRQQGL